MTHLGNLEWAWVSHPFRLLGKYGGKCANRIHTWKPQSSFLTSSPLPAHVDQPASPLEFLVYKLGKMSALFISLHPLPIFRLRWVFVVAHGLSRVVVRGILVPWPGTEPVSPALEHGFLTTGPPDKSQTSPLYTSTRRLGTEGYVLLREMSLPPLGSREVIHSVLYLCGFWVIKTLESQNMWET